MLLPFLLGLPIPGPLDMSEKKVATTDHSCGGQLASISSWPYKCFEPVPLQELLTRVAALQAQSTHTWELRKRVPPHLLPAAVKSTDESLGQVLLQPKCKSGKTSPSANNSSLLKHATLLYSTVALYANPVSGDVWQKGSQCHPSGSHTHASAVQLQLSHP